MICIIISYYYCLCIEFNILNNLENNSNYIEYNDIHQYLLNINNTYKYF